MCAQHATTTKISYPSAKGHSARVIAHANSYHCTLLTPSLTPPTRGEGAFLGALLATLILAGSVIAQDYPQRPIRMVIPFPAGGSIDVIGRAIAQPWSTALGQQIVIDNRGGAGGTLGSELVARAAPDGYTILYGNSGPLSIGPHLYKKLGYDLFRDFAPVSQAVTSPFVIFATQSLPANNAAELVAYVKERPNQVNYASSGVGSGLHLVGELFQSITGTKLVHVPFKGISQALTELFAGRVQLAMSTSAGLAPHVRAGRMKGIVSTGRERSPQLPEIPTCIEASLPGLCSGSWHAIMAPAGTPRAIVNRLQQTLKTTLFNAELKEQLLAREDASAVAGTPDELAKFMRSESTRWAGIIKAVGVKDE
jgi:tripartite-type tricarboxylate transporter receptor subunit TctC